MASNSQNTALVREDGTKEDHFAVSECESAILTRAFGEVPAED
jgi:hypothetical protein